MREAASLQRGSKWTRRDSLKEEGKSPPTVAPPHGHSHARARRLAPVTPSKRSPPCWSGTESGDALLPVQPVEVVARMLFQEFRCLAISEIHAEVHQRRDTQLVIAAPDDG